MSEQNLAGSEANAFYAKCSEQSRLNCAERNRKGSGVAKMRAISVCMKTLIGN